MRALPFACLLLTVAAPALAEDRYGPPSAAPAAPITYAPVAHLRWAGKVEPAAPQAQSAEEPVRPLADGLLRRTSAYAAAPAPAPAARPAAPTAEAATPPAENAPWRRLTAASSAPRPTAAPMAMEEAAPQARPTTPVVAPSTPTPPAPGAAATPGEQARYYSLHREYGETPDAIPAPDKSQVFLAGGPLASGVGDGDEAIDTQSTGRTAALNKARLAADWGSSSAR